MSWCPKCRSEYVNGRKTCADCGSILVDSLEDVTSDKDMYDFDNLSDEMKRRVLGEMQRQNIDPRTVLSKQSATGSPDNIASIIEMENGPSYEEYEAAAKKEVEEIPHEFVLKETRLKDYKSTGYIFTIVGGIGLLVMLAQITGLITLLPLSAGSKYIFFTVMTVMFVLFILVGINSFRACGRLKKEAAEENVYLNELNSWIDENITADIVDSDISTKDVIELYNMRADKIRSLLKEHDENMSPELVEHLIEKIYSSLYEA